MCIALVRLREYIGEIVTCLVIRITNAYKWTTSSAAPYCLIKHSETSFKDAANTSIKLEFEIKIDARKG